MVAIREHSTQNFGGLLRRLKHCSQHKSCVSWANTQPRMVQTTAGKEPGKGWTKGKKVSRLQTSQSTSHCPGGCPSPNSSAGCTLETPPQPTTNGLLFAGAVICAQMRSRAKRGPVSQKRLQSIPAPNPIHSHRLGTKGHP